MALSGHSYVPSVNFFGALGEIGDTIALGRAAAAQEEKDKALLGGPGYKPPVSFIDKLVGTVSPQPAAATPVSRETPVGPAGSDFLPAFAQAGERYGVSPSYLSRTAQIESGMDPNAHNPSGATGLMQFVPSTARQYGLTNPRDPNASIDAAARLAADNKRTLAASLGRDPSDAELYLAHQQGAGGAAKLLANPNVPAADIVGRQAVIQNGGRPDMTAGEFAGMWTNKYSGGEAGPPVQVADASGRVPVGGMGAPTAPPFDSGARLKALFPTHPGLQTPEGITAAMNAGSPHVRAIAKQAWEVYTKDLEKQQGRVSTVSDPEELRALGVPSDFKGIVQRDATGKLHVQKFGPETQVNIDNKGESEQAKELGRLNAKAIDELRKAGDDAPAQISKLNLLGKMLDDVKTGALAPAQANIARYGKAFGLSDEVVREFLHADPRLPATQQAATKLINEMTVGMIGQGKFPANNFSDADRRFITDIFPNIANEPEANKLAVEVQKRMQRRMIEKAESWDRYSEWQERTGKQPSYEKFDREFRKDVQKRDLFGDIAVSKPKKEWAQPKLGGVPIPPADARALQAHPELRDTFDQTYGAGAADRVLGPGL